MSFMINKYSNTPMYSQLKSIILRKIESGQYQEGSKIPSEEELCETYGISRPTVRQAINELNSGGFLFRKKGKGTFVSKRSSVIGIKKFSGFNGSILTEGNQSGKNMLYVKSTTSQENPKLADVFSNILPDSKFACVENILSKEDDDSNDLIPYARILSYIPLSIFPDIIEGISGNRPMVELLKGKYPFIPHLAKSTLEIVTAVSEDSDRLKIQPGQSIIKVTSIIYSKGGQVVEVVISLYRADKCKLFFENTAH